MKKTPFIITIAAIVAILDFITKKMIVATINPSNAIDILPFLRIVLVKNTGAAFGLFASLGNAFFLIITIIAIIFIIVYLIKIPKGLELVAISLILGGAIGNFIDRATIGEVVDFIDFYVGTWHWPAFNVADSALTIGITLFIWANIIGGNKNIDASSNKI
ncbi:MAG: signal peptidase II [Thermodesulfovibrionia bacterium]|nr:signal peptidase II [Thermodesulfovibrionia bacterium]